MTTMFKEKANNIEFRKKFERFVNEGNRATIEEAFVSFCSKPEEFAKDCLWRLTYQGENIDETMEDLVEAVEEQVEGNVAALRNELRFQYEKGHPNFLGVTISEDGEEAFLRLRNISDEIVAWVVYEHCRASIYADRDIERTLFLLKDEKEAYFFGGLRSLRFSKEEADYLKPYHQEIHDLLQVMYEAKKVEEKAFENRPFEGLAQLLEDAGVELAKPVEESQDDLPFFMEEQVDRETPIEEEAEEEVNVEEIAIDDSEAPNFKPVTLENVREDFGYLAWLVKTDICRVMLPAILQLGYDLNELVEKSQMVEDLIEEIRLINE